MVKTPGVCRVYRTCQRAFPAKNPLIDPFWRVGHDGVAELSYNGFNANLKSIPMPLAEEDLEQIRRLIREEVAAQTAPPQGVVRYDLELRERMVRVEEELRHQRELMEQGFRLMEKRFEQVDKRFEEMRQDMNLRFQQVDKRFEQMDHRFEILTARIDRFMKWSFALTLTIGGLVVAAIKYLP